MLAEDPLVLEQQIKKEKQYSAERALRRAERTDAKLAQERDKAKERAREREREESERRRRAKERERRGDREKGIRFDYEREKERDEERDEEKRRKMNLERERLKLRAATGAVVLESGPKPRKEKKRQTEAPEPAKKRQTEAPEPVLKADAKREKRAEKIEFTEKDKERISGLMHILGSEDCKPFLAAFALSALAAAYATLSQHGSFNDHKTPTWKVHAAIWTCVIMITFIVFAFKALLEYFLPSLFRISIVHVRIVVNLYLIVAAINFFLTMCAHLATTEVGWGERLFNSLTKGSEPIWWMISDNERDWDKSLATKLMEELESSLSLVPTDRDNWFSATYKKGASLLFNTDNWKLLVDVIQPLIVIVTGNTALAMFSSMATSNLVAKTGLPEEKAAKAVNLVVENLKNVAGAKPRPPDPLEVLIDKNEVLIDKNDIQWLLKFWGTASLLFLGFYQKLPQETFTGFTWFSGLSLSHYMYSYMINSIKEQIRSEKVEEVFSATTNVVDKAYEVAKQSIALPIEFAASTLNFIGKATNTLLLLPAPELDEETAQIKLHRARSLIFQEAGVCTYGGARIMLKFMATAADGPVSTAWSKTSQMLRSARALSINTKIASTNGDLGARILGFNRYLVYGPGIDQTCSPTLGELDTPERWMSSDAVYTNTDDLLFADIFSPSEEVMIKEAITEFDNRISKFFSYEQITNKANLWKEAGFYVDRVISEHRKTNRLGYIGAENMRSMIGALPGELQVKDEIMKARQSFNSFSTLTQHKRGWLESGAECDLEDRSWLLDPEDVNIDAWVKSFGLFSSCVRKPGTESSRVCSDLLGLGYVYTCYGDWRKLRQLGIEQYCFGNPDVLVQISGAPADEESKELSE